MIRISKYLLFIAFVFTGCAPQHTSESTVTEEGAVLPYTVHEYTLPNGLQVVSIPYESPGLASFYIVVRVGSREEVEEGKTGFAHFFEHMMFRGTEKYPPHVYDKVLQEMGASANANTWLDRTVYHMTGNAERLEQMFEMEADRFLNLKYSEADFKVEAGAVLGEYTKDFASQWMQLNEKVVERAFDLHTYGHTTMGFLDDIIDMPNQYEYSKVFYERFYRPEYTTIIVVGDISPQQVNAYSEKYFGNWKRGAYRAEIPVEPPQTGTMSVHISNPGFLPFVGLAYKSPAFSDIQKDFAALEIISTLAFSPRSEIHRKLVMEEQKAQALWSYIFKTRDPYLFNIGAIAHDEKDLQYIKDEMVKALQQLKEQTVDEQLLNDTKSHIRYSFAMGIDYPDAISNAMSEFIWLTGDPNSLNRYYHLLDQVSPEDVKRVAQMYFNPNSLTISTVSSQEKGGVR